MPQFDQINTFLSQIFWMFASLGVIYLFLSRVAIPKVNDVLKKRQIITTSDFETAASLKNDAVEINAKFEEKTAKTRLEALEVMSAASKKAEEEYNKAFSAAEADLKKEISIAEKEILSAKEKANDDLKKQVSNFVQEVLKKFAGIKVDKATLEKTISEL